jgi:acylphosphatase
MPLEAREVFFRGRVQGVGFRMTTRRVAVDFKVTGYVRNLADGRVQVWAEGEPAEIERFIAAVQKTMKDYIEGTEIKSHPASGQHKTFEIRE